MSSKASMQATVLALLQTLWHVVTGLPKGGTAAAQRLRHACIQHFAGTDRPDCDHCHSRTEPEYGYKGKLAEILEKDFPQLLSRVYADHAGATLYTQTQLEAMKQDLESHLFGNPHSQHGWSGNDGSGSAVAEARQLTLDMCNAPLGQYECVFTSGATGALKLVGEAFPWQQGSQCVYTQDNHNSVLGIRGMALDGGASATCVQINSSAGQPFDFIGVSPSMQRPCDQPPKVQKQEDVPSRQGQPVSSSPSSFLPSDVQSARSDKLLSSSSAVESDMGLRAAAGRSPCLFAFPLESNFSGERHEPAVVNQIRTSGLSILSRANEEEGEQTQIQPQLGMQTRLATDQQLSSKQQRLTGEGQQAVQTPHKEEQGHREEEQGLGQPSGLQEEACRSGGQGQEGAAEGLNASHSQPSGDRWHVLIDAAKACATAPPDLTKHPADFVALSYYKIFGYPTGLGALLVHKRAVPLLMKRKRYFGGGTVAVSLAEEDFFRRRPGGAGLEDGTAHYLGIAALRHGFRQLASLGGFPAIASHTQAVTRLFADQLAQLQHACGTPLCVIYGNHEPPAQQGTSSSRAVTNSPGAVGQGPVVTFNLLRPDGTFFGYREVEKLAGLQGIYLRTGCFCNPGACAHHLGLTASQLKQNYEAGHVCWDDHDIIDGRPTGAVRVSFGWMSSVADVEAILTFLSTSFLDSAGSQNHNATLNKAASGRSDEPVSVSHAIDQLPSRKLGQKPVRVDAHCSSAMPAAADNSHRSPVHKVRGSSHQPVMQQTEKNRQLPGHQARLVQPAHAHHSQEQLTKQNPDMHAWLQQLPWVRCGDTVTAWTASEHESQRSASQSQASTSMSSGRTLSESAPNTMAASSKAAIPETSPRSVQSDSVPQLWPQPPSSSASPFPDSASIAQSASDSNSKSVLHPESQDELDSQHKFSSLQDTSSASCQHSESQPSASQGSLDGIWVYPIKSCGAIRVSEWPLGPNGLLLDREWALVGDDGHVLTQKTLPQLALVQPRVDLSQSTMQVSLPGMTTHLLVLLPTPAGSETSQASHGAEAPGKMLVRVCADNVCSLQEVFPGDSQEEVRTWFQQALGIRCCLVRQRPGSRKPISPMQLGRDHGQGASGHIGFANEGQFLLMNSASLADMNARINAQPSSSNSKKKTATVRAESGTSNVGDLSRFRPNLLVGGAAVAAYAEDEWETVQIGAHEFFTAGPCARCEMICMDQTTAVRAGPEPLLTLASYRRRKGRVLLGILLGQREHHPCG